MHNGLSLHGCWFITQVLVVKQAVAYIRVSREDENPANQIHAIMQWARENGYQVVGVFQDVAVSGAVDPFQRPGFKTMLEFMKATGVNTIIVAELERLTRDVEHFEKLRDLKSVLGWAVEQDVEIVSIADVRFTELVSRVRSMIRELRSALPQELSFLKPVYELVSRILVSVVEILPEIRISMAQAERERVRERTKRALDRLRSEGRVYTKPTFIQWLALYRSGKRSLSELTRDDVEAAKRYFIEQYVKPYREGVPARRLYRKFIEMEKPVIDFIRKLKQESGRPVKTTYASYTAFYTLLKKLRS